jgi:hypothetical protein
MGEIGKCWNESRKLKGNRGGIDIIKSTGNIGHYTVSGQQGYRVLQLNLIEYIEVTHCSLQL